ncbi:SbcC/MukB-like Walker B domain-containing protein [Streptomyces sp. C11-1]|uniref:SbcC/MukB-like Walker B domain-containing protein n=1 Tax=Streptomyces durocortorensis TaxID=2811104 RepID=A0ABY9VNX1_9ACTN|nr:SbcC/MukB-like Walker B domain-containing protein [Streptomyces durocortorensis]WNF25320.1 SbcC/MukB-like Walker B domain-containing protein [Streptomyces durocortorensis]
MPYDLPPGTKAARELLLKDPDRITDEDREALHTFFRGRIEEAKAKNTAATWEEQLSEVLDYTAWHQFVVKLDRTGGTDWQLLTKKLHGALSGGEKAIALHLPLFAAVAAHHEAVPHAPRLILLDEVFVGVDTTNRGQAFTLLSALDLDLMLTSDHEWCTYRELPASPSTNSSPEPTATMPSPAPARMERHRNPPRRHSRDLSMTTPTPAARLNRPALRPVWQTIHNRLSSGRPVARVRLGPLGDEQCEALADLMGWDRLPDTHPTLTLTHLQAALAVTSPLT